MRKLVLVLLAIIAVVTFIQAFDHGKAAPLDFPASARTETSRNINDTE